MLGYTHLGEPMKTKQEWFPCISLGNIMNPDIWRCSEKIVLSKVRIKQARRSWRLKITIIIKKVWLWQKIEIKLGKYTSNSYYGNDWRVGLDKFCRQNFEQNKRFLRRAFCRQNEAFNFRAEFEQINGKLVTLMICITVVRKIEN